MVLSLGRPLLDLKGQGGETAFPDRAIVGWLENNAAQHILSRFAKRESDTTFSVGDLKDAIRMAFPDKRD